MRPENQERYLLHATLPQHRRKVAQARAIIQAALASCPSWYVAFSTGKDSTCVLALVREVLPTAAAHHSLHQRMLPESTAYLERTANVRLVAYQNFDGTDWAQRWESREAAEAAGARWLNDDEIDTRGAPEAGVFIGLRAEENSYRKAHLRRNGALFFAKDTGRWHCNPIAWWSVEDVWAYILSHQIDYNAAYDKLDEMGIPAKEQRIGPLAVERALGYGQLAILRQGWPEIYRDLVARFPETAAYT